MFAVGHFALGYLTGKLASVSLNVKLNIPLLFIASIFPDVDILIPGLEHRGPLHSVVIFCIIFVPIFLIYKKRAAPYFLALVSHSLIGDILTGGARLLWPLSYRMVGIRLVNDNMFPVILELVLFLISIAVMFKTKDLFSLFRHNPANIVLSIPLVSILLPTFVHFPLAVPSILVIPHFFYLGLFIISILIDLNSIWGIFNKKIIHSS